MVCWFGLGLSDAGETGRLRQRRCTKADDADGDVRKRYCDIVEMANMRKTQFLDNGTGVPRCVRCMDGLYVHTETMVYSLGAFDRAAMNALCLGCWILVLITPPSRLRDLYTT